MLLTEFNNKNDKQNSCDRLKEGLYFCVNFYKKSDLSLFLRSLSDLCDKKWQLFDSKTLNDRTLIVFSLVKQTDTVKDDSLANSFLISCTFLLDIYKFRF